MNIKIISGGQTGVDRAALDVAIELCLPCGGYCPRGRRSEDGVIPEKYPLEETISEEYSERTEKNVLSSDGTMVLVCKEPDMGTSLTIDFCRSHRKQYLVIDLSQSTPISEPIVWLETNKIKVLNVAGSRESSSNGIYRAARDFLLKLFVSN